MIHSKDKGARNPRLKCVVCGEWKRLSGRDEEDKYLQRFFGGCGCAVEARQKHAVGCSDDHLAHKDNDYDVCENCCHIACKQIADALIRSTIHV